ncbi:MAG: DUF1416 domain-containing protein [Candidatus Dormibacteraeota bacterium]|nr:DUF1416 domain-containing protein [Candidatus Dormibacteraeota bacterium]MBV9526386.1 DUF1416 domain-containing protein [Candidatus Dormibacteraeota bacterium]
MRLHGRVVRSGEPVEGAYVQLLGPSGDFTAEVRTDETGRFVFYPVPGDWVLKLFLPGGYVLEQAVSLSEGQTMSVQLVGENARARGEPPPSR